MSGRSRRFSRCSGRHWALVVLVLLVLLGWQPHARGGVLRYQVPAGSDCPAKSEFTAEVSSRLGFSPWQRANGLVQVKIDVSETGFVGRLQRHKAEKTFSGGTCAAVFELLVSATTMSLDRRARSSSTTGRARNRTPTRTSTGSSAGSGSDFGVPRPSDLVHQWSFAERNNSYQLGVVMTQYAGFGFTGNVPVPWAEGHLQATAAQTSADSALGGESRLRHLHVYFLLPVFYLNERSNFEVPVFAGGGLGYTSFSFEREGDTSMHESAFMPTLAAGTGLQFRRWPVEFMTQMSYSFVNPPGTSLGFGFDVAIRYVFRDER